MNYFADIYRFGGATQARATTLAEWSQCAAVLPCSFVVASALHRA